MFARATPAAEELAQLRAKTPIVGDWLPQPCVFHDGARCGIYEARPTVCRVFVCAALAAWTGGELALDVAVSRVGETKAVLASLTTRMREDAWLAPGETPAEAWMRLIKAIPAMTSPVERRRYARLLVEAVVAVKALKDLAGDIELG